MKKYSDVCAILASRVFSNYMNGSYDTWGSVSDSLSIVAFIYEKQPKQVEKDIEKEFKRMQDEHYKKVKT